MNIFPNLINEKKNKEIRIDINGADYAFTYGN